jgi:formamidopyrimidine-DNA glycosylase
MPELPEVETVRRQLEPAVVGRRILTARAHPSDRFRDAAAAGGASVTGLARRGKWLIAGLDDGRDLIVHLGMTGQLTTVAAGDPVDAYERAAWVLNDGTEVRLRDVRRFGRVAVTATGRHETLAGLHRLGPEPLAGPGEAYWWDPQVFAATLARSAATVKAVLLDGRAVAGVGNIYADEAALVAGVNPAARRLGTGAALRLHAAVRQVLLQGLGNGGTTLRDYRDATGASGSNQARLAAYGRAGLPCLRCETVLASGRIAGRGTTWCPDCQPL